MNKEQNFRLNAGNGLGLAEERLGLALSGIPRGDFILSTKVGRVLHQDRSGFEYDYSHDGVMRGFQIPCRLAGWVPGLEEQISR